MAKIKKRNLTIPNDGENAGKQKLSLTAAGNAKWYSHLERHFSNFSQRETQLYHATEQYLVFNQDLIQMIQNVCLHKNLHANF